jgi:protoheme IX farnesyltransferase
MKEYLTLTKPGIIIGNAITAAGGFALGSKGTFDSGLFLSTIAGLSFVIGSACVFNNYLDRDIDKVMERTKDRAFAKGSISTKAAFLYGASLGIIGTAVLLLNTNLLTTFIGLIGFFVYVLLYTPIKRRSVHGTLVGSIAGAVPPVVGYCAVTNQFDIASLLLFLILVFWQMPHFFAIAIYRLKDYSAAAIPVLPIIKGILATKIQILIYIIAFVIASLMLFVLGYTGYLYLTITTLLSLIWLCMAIIGFSVKDTQRWAREMFITSLVVLTLNFVVIAVDVIR